MHFSRRERDGNYDFDRIFLHVETCNLGFYGSKIELSVCFTGVIDAGDEKGIMYISIMNVSIVLLHRMY